MELVISILILFILVNCLLKLSFWKGWQAALFGLICGIFITATYPVAILQSKTQLADYLQNTVALQNMAVIITLEAVVCFAYCVAVLRGWFGQQEKWWVKPLKWYPTLLIFPVLFYLQTELIFSFPGISFSILSYVFAIGVVVMIPLLCYFFRYGNVTYQAVKEPTNWKALAFAFGLFLIFFLLGMGWNKLKWVLLQKRGTRKTTSRK